MKEYVTDIEPGTQSNIVYPVSKRLTILLCHGHLLLFKKKMERLNSGDKRIVFVTNLSALSIGLMKCGRAKWQEAEETRKDFSTVLIVQEQFLYLRALQGHSGRNLIDPSSQDNVLIRDKFFEYICHIGCAVILHSTEFRIDTVRTNFEQNTDGILHVCASNEQRTSRSRKIDSLAW